MTSLAGTSMHAHYTLDGAAVLRAGSSQLSGAQYQLAAVGTMKVR